MTTTLPIIDVVGLGASLMEVQNLRRRKAINNEVRRQVRRVTSHTIHIKQQGDVERDLIDVLVPFFREQVEHIVKGLTELGETKSTEDVAAIAMKLIFNPDDWTSKLTDATLPVLGVGMVKAGVGFLVDLGIDPRKAYRSPEYPVQSPEAAPEGHRDLSPIDHALTVGTPESPSYRVPFPPPDRKTTATEWLHDHPEDLEVLEAAMVEAGVPIGILTELPPWMQKSIATNLAETYKQPYWRGVSEDTGGWAEQTLNRGLKDGWSINRIAKTMSDAAPGYSKMRATRVARTESGNALNGARKASQDQLAKEIPEVPMRASWLSVLGNTTRDTHAMLDGVPADAEGMWFLGGISIPWPAHFALPPEERCNCACSTITEFGMDESAALEAIQEHEERTGE